MGVYVCHLSVNFITLLYFITFTMQICSLIVHTYTVFLYVHESLLAKYSLCEVYAATLV